MKFMKYTVVLAIALCAFASASKAQTVQFLGGGSSALYLELGQAAQSAAATSTPCLWTYGSDPAILARDNRTAVPTDEKGNIWITWGPGTGTCAAPVAPFNIYSYMSLDSVVGDKCYFEVDSSGIPGCVQVITLAAGTAGINKLQEGASFTDSPGGIPANVIAALTGQHFFVGGTDIRPEDAKFATLRAFTRCDTAFYRQPFDQGLRQTYGIGYQTATPGVGTPIKSDYSSAQFNVLDFNIAGNDPITSPAQPVPAFTVQTVGAQPIVVVVSPVPAAGTGIGAATDINGFTLTQFLDGVSGRSTDLYGPTTANTVTTLVREPLSGTYNTMEFSVPNGSQFQSSQEAQNCNYSTGTVFSNPMHLQSTNGAVAAIRRRVIGTGQMVSTLKAATTDTLGYFFWSAGNATGFTATNGKYLTVNGVDPLKDAYTDGVIPTIAAGTLGTVTFKNLNQGDYPIWSALRLVSKSPTPAGVTAVIAAAQTLNSAQHDFITLANLKVVHSHFYLPAIGNGVNANGTTLNPATPNDLCSSPGALAEIGGDVGGSNVPKQVNFDFCADFGNQNGLINKTN